MNYLRCLWVCFVLVGSAAMARADSVVIDRGPHHDLHQHIEASVSAGQTNYVTNSWTVLQPGLNFYSETNQAWVPSSTQIDLAEVGAEFKRGPLKIKFNPNHNAGPIEYTLPGHAAPLKIKTIGIALSHANGDSVWLGETRDANGLLDGNSITYSDAFEGVKADIRTTVSIGKLTSDIILREQIIAPQAFGWAADTCNIEVWHEIVSSPAGVVRPSAIPRANGANDSDEQLEFGEMFIGPGTAFLIGTNRAPVANEHGPVRVAKELFNDPENQKNYLIEHIPYSEAVAHLLTLPVPEEARVNRDTLKEKLEGGKVVAETGKRRKPVSMAGIITRPAPKVKGERKVASITRGTKAETSGFVLDYTIVAGAANYRFKGDTTYYVTNDVTLTSTTSIEGGTVIKFGSGTTPVLKMSGPVNCETGPYSPAIFTSKDDNTVGETISGSSGAPSGDYGDVHFYITTANANATSIHDVRSRYARVAFAFLGSANHEIYNVQILNASKALMARGNTLTVRNFLADRVGNVLHCGLNNTHFKGEHFTVHRGGRLLEHDGFTGGDLYLTNSLLVIITNTSTSVTSQNVTTLTSDAGVFQTVGAGSHYLADGSPYRDAGSASVSTNLTLGVFPYATTYPPLLLTNNFAIDTVLFPQAKRDRDNLDIGYHYPSVDWLIGGATVNSGVTLLLTNGVSIGLFGATSLSLGSGSHFVSEGRPLQLNRIAGYNTVQEQPTGLGSVPSPLIGGSDSAATINIAFTEVSLLGSGSMPHTLVAADSDAFDSIRIKDSVIRNASVLSSRDYMSDPVDFIFANSMFLRCYLYFDQSFDGEPLTLDVKNSLIRYSEFSLGHYNTGSPAFHLFDNLFDSSVIGYWSEGTETVANGNNGYLNTTALSGGSNNKTISTGDFQTGVLGAYYYPTSGANLFTLVNAGSQTVANAALYHFTVRTDHTKDTSTVDIGYHVAAIDSNGAVDTDGDGIPDYLEDLDGDGTADSNETNWNGSNGVGSGAAVLVVFTPLQ